MPASDNHSSLRPPSTSPTSDLRPPRADSPTQSNSKTFWVWAFFLLLAILAAALPILLPNWMSKQSMPPVATDPPYPVGSEAVIAPEIKTVNDTSSEKAIVASPATNVNPPASRPDLPVAENLERENATEALQAYLRIGARPELDQVEVWGDPQWDEVEQALAAGELALEAAQYPTAANQYQRATELLTILIDSRQQRLQASLAGANAALAQDDSSTAVQQFELGLTIDANNQAATEGLARAQARPALLAKMEIGRTKEKEDDLQAALAAYEAAAELDPAYSKAVEAAQRLETRILARDFSTAMSKGLAAIQSGQLDVAESALGEVRRLRPEHPALQDALAQLTQKQQQRDLSQLRRQAELQDRVEGWQTAEKLYQKALAIDPNAAFAKQGLRKAQDRLYLHRQLDHYLEAPDRLHSSKPFDNARQLLATTSAVNSAEPKLLQKASALRKLIELAGKKVTVKLQSDEKTEVAVYQVGRMGRFAEKTMSLRPGKYTIVGSREGYRDVRQVVEVRADAELQSILVRCTEPL